MVIIGCDFHPSGQQGLAIDDQSGEVVSEGWLDHAGDEAEQFYAALPAGAVTRHQKLTFRLLQIRRMPPK